MVVLTDEKLNHTPYKLKPFSFLLFSLVFAALNTDFHLKHDKFSFSMFFFSLNSFSSSCPALVNDHHDDNCLHGSSNRHKCGLFYGNHCNHI